MNKTIKNNKIIITDALSKEQFQGISDIMFSDKFPWFYQDHLVHPHQANTDERLQIQFVHKFHEVSNIVTGPELWNMLIPIFTVLQPHTFLRVKANNIPSQSEIVTHGMHCDVSVPLSYTAIQTTDILNLKMVIKFLVLQTLWLYFLVIWNTQVALVQM